VLAFLILGTLVVLGAPTVLAASVGSAAWWVLLGVLGVLLLVGVYAELYDWLRPGQLLAEPPMGWVDAWERAHPDRF
jgi:hypothetical protein